MRLVSALITATILAAASAAQGAALPAPQQVNIPQGSAALHALLYKPDGDGPFPAVIALHACGGLATHAEAIQARYRDWAEQLVKAGNAVLLPDSYGSRELGPQCRVNSRSAGCWRAANGLPTFSPRVNGWCSRRGCRMIVSGSWDGPMAPARCCGRYARNCRPRPIRTSVPRLRSIRIAG